MTAAIQVDPERRQHSVTLIDELQKERRQVWSLYCRVAEMKPFKSDQQLLTMLTEFAQILIDYVSLGHFGLFQRIIDGNERRTSVLSLVENIYPRFIESTDGVVAFNDKYEKLDTNYLTNDLELDLSQLGENLAKRMDLEDQLCKMMVM